MKNYEKKRPTAEDAVEAYHDPNENTDILGSYTGICRDPGMRYGLSSLGIYSPCGTDLIYGFNQYGVYDYNEDMYPDQDADDL